MAAPPKARAGEPFLWKGRPVVAGVALSERLLTGNAVIDELWSELRVLHSEVGYERLRKLHGRALDEVAFHRVSTYLRQAEAFYISSMQTQPESRPLAAYYAILNLCKALLTCLNPSITKGRSFHGLSDDFVQKQKYWFTHERTKIQASGIFRELALRTGEQYCYAAGHTISVQGLAPYLVETVDLYENAIGDPPKLIPIESLQVLKDNSAIWLRAEIDRGALRQRGLGPESLLKRAGHLGAHFRLVQSETASASYESITNWTSPHRMDLRLPALAAAFEASLIHTRRDAGGKRHYAVISSRPHLLSQEAVSLITIHHMSNMVRYRPEQVDKLRDSKWFFLFSTWLPRATENLALALASRLLKEEVRVP